MRTGMCRRILCEAYLIEFSGCLQYTQFCFYYNHYFPREIYRSIAELQAYLDRWMYNYNNKRTHICRYCFGKRPMQTLIDSIPLAQEKLLEKLAEYQFLEGPHKKGTEESESMHSEEKSYIHKSHLTTYKTLTIKLNRDYFI